MCTEGLEPELELRDVQCSRAGLKEVGGSSEGKSDIGVPTAGV
jgi:hypothetical protein